MNDCQRLLQVLSDGKPHGHAELYRLGMIVHSRVADLRKQGYRIDCRPLGRVNGRAVYEYQLQAPLEEPQSSAFGDEPILARMATDAGRGSSSGEQLTLVPPSYPRERFA